MLNIFKCWTGSKWKLLFFCSIILLNTYTCFSKWFELYFEFLTKSFWGRKQLFSYKPENSCCSVIYLGTAAQFGNSFLVINLKTAVQLDTWKQLFSYESRNSCSFFIWKRLFNYKPIALNRSTKTTLIQVMSWWNAWF